MSKKRVFLIFSAIAAVLLLTGSAWAAAGGLIWQKQITFPEYDTIRVNAMAVSATAFLISGVASHSTGGGSIGFLKAYDVATGALKWSKTLSLGTYGNGIGGLIVDGDLVLVRGSASSSTTMPPSPPDFTMFKNYIWAYNADTGKLVWQGVKNFEVGPPPPPNGNINAPGSTGTIVANDRVFFSSFVIDTTGKTDFSKCTVRAYQVRDLP